VRRFIWKTRLVKEWGELKELFKYWNCSKGIYCVNRYFAHISSFAYLSHHIKGLWSRVTLQNILELLLCWNSKKRRKELIQHAFKWTTKRGKQKLHLWFQKCVCLIWCTGTPLIKRFDATELCYIVVKICCKTCSWIKKHTLHQMTSN
jgi:hypothetical protein